MRTTSQTHLMILCIQRLEDINIIIPVPYIYGMMTFQVKSFVVLYLQKVLSRAMPWDHPRRR